MAADNFTVIIVGGGPVGLTAAHALYQAGIDFIILERRDSVAIDQGASLVLGPPSLRVMHQFGLLNRLLEIGGELQHNKAFTREGYEFKDSFAVRLIRKNHGTAPVAFHRAHLIQTLYDGLPDNAKGCLLTNKKVVNITSGDAGVRVSCADGSVYDGSIVLGADGVHSKTRNLMRSLALEADPKVDWDPECPYTVEYKCMWCSFPRPSETGEGFETSHKDRSIMYLTGHDRGWIFLYERLPKPTKERISYTQEDAEAFAAEFADYPVTERLKVKDVFAERLTMGMAPLEEGILQHWSWGRIALVGDACHKFTPNAGLGLNSGIQDVVVLCNGLHRAVQNAPDGKPDTAVLCEVFDKYQRVRSESVHGDAAQSARLTRLHAWSNAFYFILARYIMSWDFIQNLLINFLAANSMKKGRVLDYVSTNEPFQGKVRWDYQMKS